MNTDKENWQIYYNNSGTSSNLVRGYILIVTILSFYALTRSLLSYCVLFAILDLSQYVSNTISYNILARLQELQYIKEDSRPGYFNWSGKFFWLAKMGTAFYSLFLLGWII